LYGKRELIRKMEKAECVGQRTGIMKHKEIVG